MHLNAIRVEWLSTPLVVNENDKLTRQNVYLYLIKLAQQKDVNLILTRNCFTIVIKTIQLSSHIIKHDEFIKATFTSEQFFETNNIFAVRGKNPFLFSLSAWREKTQWCQICAILQQTKISGSNRFHEEPFPE